MNKKVVDDQQWQQEKEEQTKMLVGKIRRAKKKNSSPRLEKKQRKRTRRKNSIVDIQHNQKHRRVSSGKARGTRSRLTPSSDLPALCWSSASLMCHLTSKHQIQRNCLQTHWRWSTSIDSNSSSILLDDNQRILFHPRTSSSTQVILADRPLTSYGKHYWEIYMPAVYGTSIMFGIATAQQNRTSTSFTNLIGMDQHGWALSHNGLLWHNGVVQPYLSKPLETLQPCLIGLEFDGKARTLSYTINNQSMGIAFRNIPNNVRVYPAVSSTSAQSTMILKHRCKTYSSLRETCLGALQSLDLRLSNRDCFLPRHLLEELFSNSKTVS